MTTDSLIVSATERLMTCSFDYRAVFGTPGRSLPPVGKTIFRTEAESRGFCMSLWDSRFKRWEGAQAA